MSDGTETPAAAAPSDTAPEVPTPAPAVEPASASTAEGSGRPARKVREGVVVSDRMDKTVVVAVIDRVRHRRYAKTVQRTTRLAAHDESNDVKVGDRVRVMETRPLSKQKRWRVIEVMERAR